MIETVLRIGVLYECAFYVVDKAGRAQYKYSPFILVQKFQFPDKSQMLVSVLGFFYLLKMTFRLSSALEAVVFTAHTRK